ncbi:MAG: membrane dipeptidase [Myxococcota bacterium]
MARGVARWARELGVSEDATALVATSDVLDLHLDTFIWRRVFGYDPRRRHGFGLFGRRYFGQVDFPRARESGLDGGTWVITTNPFKPSRWRRDAFFANLDALQGLLAEGGFRHVRTAAEYRAARAAGAPAAFLGVQGGNALDHDLRDLERLPPLALLRVTLVHLTASRLGQTSAPGGRLLRRGDGLTGRGRELVERMNAGKIVVDLAHASPRTFWDAVRTNDRTIPFWVTHTGVSGVYPHWRNVDDDQLRAVADAGGVVGIMYQESFLGRRDVTSATVFAHLAHVVKVAGEDVAALGSDWDGAITPPRDLRTPGELPNLVQRMLDAGWSDTRIRKVLGGNVLRSLEAVRG